MGTEVNLQLFFLFYLFQFLSCSVVSILVGDGVEDYLMDIPEVEGSGGLPVDSVAQSLLLLFLEGIAPSSHLLLSLLSLQSPPL